MTTGPSHSPRGWAFLMRRDAATTAVLIALAVAVGILLAPIPNVEGISAVSFFAGLLTGWKRGALVGATAMALLSLLNPLGPAPPPVALAQVAGMGAIGAAGRVARLAGTRRVRLEVLAMVSGALVTFAYDALTNYGVAVAMGKWRDPWVVLLAGVPLGAVHLVSNTMVFAAVAALVVRKPWLALAGRLSGGKR